MEVSFFGMNINAGTSLTIQLFQRTPSRTEYSRRGIISGLFSAGAELD